MSGSMSAPPPTQPIVFPHILYVKKPAPPTQKSPARPAGPSLSTDYSVDCIIDCVGCGFLDPHRKIEPTWTLYDPYLPPPDSDTMDPNPQREVLALLGLAPLQPLQPLQPLPPALNENEFFFNLQELNEVDEIDSLDKELGKMNVPLDRMLTWADMCDYHRYKFVTGRTFKNRGYYASIIVDFYHRLFYAYPEDLRTGLVEYDPNIHEVQTMLYECQLRRLEELAEEERMGLH